MYAVSFLLYYSLTEMLFIFGRCQSGILFEKAREIIQIGKTRQFCNLTKRIVIFANQSFDIICFKLMIVLNWRKTVYHFKLMPKMVGTYIKLLCSGF